MALNKEPRKALIVAALVSIVSVVAGCDTRDSGVNNVSYKGYEIRATESVYAYRASSPYASVLKQCVGATTVSESCPLTTLPFIGNGTNTPTIEQVMERVLVTHDWMGVRFEQVLRTAPDTLLSLFSSTTAILMGSNVRPSFYTRLNGAIQIDPVYLWTTLEEKNSISKAEDFRSNYGADLQFWFLSRLAKPDGERLAPYYSLDDNSVRPVEDIQMPLIRLLFHELSHATDFMPRNQISGVNSDLSVYDAIDSVRDSWLSSNLLAMHPLNNDALFDFAQVRFRGEAANAQQQATTAAGMGELMETDGAIQFYSYTSQYEDLAQLVEGVMMAYHYGSIINAGFTQKPSDEDNYSCDDLLMGWGQRNRLSDPLVNVRSRRAADLVVNLSPEMLNYLDNDLGSVEAMDITIDWCNNQRPNSFAAAEVQTRSPGFTSPLNSGSQFREMMRVESIVHPDGLNYD